MQSNNTLIQINLDFSEVGVLVVDEKSHTITMRMYMGISWREPRLISTSSTVNDLITPLDLQLLQYLWVPDIDVYFVKEVKEFEVLKKIAGTSKKNIGMSVKRLIVNPPIFEYL